MNNFTDVKIQILVNSIRKRPGLYDKNSPEYKDTEWKEIAWREVAQNVNANERDCKVAWRSLRDQFIKTLKTPNKKKKYKHFNKLLFLKDSVQIKGSSLKFDEATIIDESQLDMDTAPAFVFEPCPSQSMSVPSSDDESISSEMHKITPPSSNKSYKREVDILTPTFKDVLSEPVIQTAVKEPDNVDIFFKSVSNTIKSYDLCASELAVLQCEVLNFVTNRLEEIRTSKQ